jgi:hypothetical protein
MPFVPSCIDRAIVATQFDVRGFMHELGFRFGKYECAKSISYIPGNFICFAAGYGGPEGSEPTEFLLERFDQMFVDSLAVCQKLAAACNRFEREAIQLIVIDIIEQNIELHARAGRTGEEKSVYLMPLERGNRWGNIVLALVVAFEVSLELAVSDAAKAREAVVGAQMKKQNTWK